MQKQTLLLAITLAAALLISACNPSSDSSGSTATNVTANIDSDGDGVTDNVDAFPDDGTETTDTDGDGIGNNADNCPLIANTDQTDTDGDLLGNACDSDDDDDSFEDSIDVDDDNNGLIEISNLEQLDWIRNNLNGTSLNDGSNNSDEGCEITTGCIGYELTQNLDFDTNGDGVMDENDSYFDYDGDASNSGWLPIGTEALPFTAIFDGNDFEIQNLVINRPSGDFETSGYNIGLFGYVGSESTTTEIRNIGLTGELMSVTGKQLVGGLVGYATESSISDSYSTGIVLGSNESIGGLVGLADTSFLKGNYTTGNVTGRGNYTGGLVGQSYTSSVMNNYATGDVTGLYNTGGLVGFSQKNSIISMNYATGSVTGTNNDTGGLLGFGYQTTINASYATGSVKGSNITGGLLGGMRDLDSSVNNSYATGSVVGNENTGGLIGYIEKSFIVASHWAIDTSNQNNGFGINKSSTVELTGASLAQLKCPTSANDTSCLTGETLFEHWDAIDHDNDDSTDVISPWIFGDSSTLPTLDMSITVP